MALDISSNFLSKPESMEPVPNFLSKPESMAPETLEDSFTLEKEELNEDDEVWEKDCFLTDDKTEDC